MASVFQSQPSKTCHNPVRCGGALETPFGFLARLGIIFKYDSIINWVGLIGCTGKPESAVICPECEKELHARNGRERRKFWDELPTIFGITTEGWASSGVEN